MTSEEIKDINARLAEVAVKFGLKIKLTVKNAQKLIDENYRKIKEIELSVSKKLAEVRKAA
jgi:hypothetical protein